MRFNSGSKLGPYEITGTIGAGGMGEVYRAKDTRLGREVAIKVLPRELTGDPERLARFEREARSASALNHRNIVTVHDFTSRDGDAWLVMELIRGESLRELLSHGALPFKKVIAIGSGIADGLAAAHNAGIVHRDLKPENVMITADGTPKILDFGLVKNRASRDITNSSTEMRVSSTGTILGTAGYMSPEQARGEEVDFRSDQFSLGLILYEMATGKNPFRRATPVETLAAILNEDAPSLSDKFPEPFVWIVERCLAKNPADRYGSTSDLAYELRRLRDRPVTTATRETRRANWWWPAIITIAVLLIIVGLLMWRRRPPAITDSYQTSVATPEIAEILRDEIALPVGLSPDGHFLVVHGMDADGIPSLWLHDLRSGASRSIARNAFSIGWSDDSKAIAYFADGKLKTVTVDGAPPRIVCDARPEGTPTWYGDNILYVQYSVKDIGIYRVKSGGGKPERIVGTDRPHSGIPFWPQFLPDGKRFLYLVILQPDENEHVSCRIGSLEGGPPRKVPLPIESRTVYANGHLLFVRDGTLLAQPFDLDTEKLKGEAKPLVTGLHYFRSTGLAAFSVSQNGVLAWRNARGISRLLLFDRNGFEIKTIGSAVFNGDGRLSPDGHRYAASIVDPRQGVADVWIYDLDRDRSERVTFAPLDEEAPVWAPDGRTLYYRCDGGGGPPDIFRLRPGEEKGSVFYSGPGVEEAQDVSPDGKWMLFVDYRQSFESHIRVLSLGDPPTAHPFTVTPFNERSPRFSPDGRWVAYQSDLSGRHEVYVRPFEGAAATMLVSKDGGTRPRWGRHGKELFYLAPGGRIMSAAMNGGRTVGSPRVLFQTAEIEDFEPTADGNRFIVQVGERSTEPPVHLLVNWPARLAAEK